MKNANENKIEIKIICPLSVALKMNILLPVNRDIISLDSFQNAKPCWMIQAKAEV